MRRPRHRSLAARRDRRAAAIVAALLAGTASQAPAQNSTTVIPAPGIERYSLPPGNSQATPTPSPTPTPAPVPTRPAVPTPSLTPSPLPSVVPTLQIPRTTPTPAPTRTPATRTPAATPSTTPTATPTPTPSARPTPTPTPTSTPASPAAAPAPAFPADDINPATPPLPTPTASATATPDAAAGGPPTWLWWIGGLAVLAALAAFVWRRFGGAAEPVDDVPDTAPPPIVPAPPSPSPPARRVADTPAAAPQPARALALDFRPQRLWTRGPDAFLAFELAITNTGAAHADAVRPVIVLASAGPDTAADIAAFNANAPTLGGGDSFALRPGETRVVAGELTLPGDSMYVTTAANRELIVPLALVNLQWRAGTSLARAADAFLIGTGDATTPRLGPIWVDRAGLVYPKLDARRFTPGTTTR